MYNVKCPTRICAAGSNDPQEAALQKVEKLKSVSSAAAAILYLLIHGQTQRKGMRKP
jgi:hypothetical protein